MKNKLNIKVAIKYFVLVAFAIITLFPFYWMISSSFKDSFEIIQTPPTMFPQNIFTVDNSDLNNIDNQVIKEVFDTNMLELVIEPSQVIDNIDEYFNSSTDDLRGLYSKVKSEIMSRDGIGIFSKIKCNFNYCKYVVKVLFTNYSKAFTMAPFGRYFINTILVTILSIISTVIIAILSAFAFSHLEFKGRDLIFSIFLASMMIPGEVLIVTNFKTISQMGLMDTYSALFVPYMANVLYIYMLREFFLKIPKQLYYAAKVDGSSDWKFLWRIVVPMAKPSIITICILVGINSWNAFLWPLLVTNKENMRLLATGLTAFQSDAGNQYELIMAASTIITMPIIAVYIFLHKKIMNGISIGGIKG